MRQIVLILLAASVCLAQSGRTYSSPGGFGNILYPGTGHAPNANPGLAPSFAHRLGTNIAGYPALAPRVNHPGHGRTQIVPYPVIYGGGYYGAGFYGSGYDAPGPGPYGDSGGQPIVNTNSAPSVVINQTFIPDHAVPVMREYGNGPDPGPQEQSGMRMYEGLRTPPQGPSERTAKRSSDEPTLYLIALKDHSIVQALGYWIEGGNLHYVSVEHTLNQASLDLIDRDLSQRLNDERNIEFKLPKAQ